MINYSSLNEPTILLEKREGCSHYHEFDESFGLDKNLIKVPMSDFDYEDFDYEEFYANVE